MDSQLQSGIGGAPKWEPRSQLGIYVGHSPAHAGSVALVLNPQMGHVSPQYHVVFDDLFTTVPFMEKSKIPPNWADLVEKSCEKVTDEHYELAKTWLFPGPEPGDISMPERNLNSSNYSNLGAYSKKTTSHTGTEPPCPSSFLDKTNGLFQSMDYVPDPFLHPVSSSYEGANLPSQIEDSLVVPRLINLETSGQWRSPRIAAMINMLGRCRHCSGNYEARGASGRKYEARIVIFCILAAVDRFSRISWKTESSRGKLDSR